MPTKALQPPERARRDPDARSITFRLPKDMHAAITVMAHTENRSRNSAVCMLITEALDARAKVAAKAAAEMKELKRLAREAKKAAKAAALAS